eukprot:gene21827-27897_t
MSSSLSMVIGGQFVIGFGAGSAVQYAGFTLTPVLGALVASMGSALSTTLWGVPLTAYSLPAIALGLVALLSTLLIFILFVEIIREESDGDTRPNSNLPEQADGMEMQRLTADSHPAYQAVPDRASGAADVQSVPTTSHVETRRLCGHSLFDVLSVAGCAFNMATKGTIGVFETLGLVYVTTHYHWSSLRSGITFSVAGAFGVMSLLLFSLLMRYVNDVNLVLCGMLIMAASCLMFSCALSSGLPLWAFYLAIGLMYSVGYPVGHTALIGIFSKLVKSGPQGRILGLFGSAGSLARIVFPLLAGVLTELYGDRVIFAVMAVILGVSCGVFAYFKTVITEYVDL